MSEPVGPPLPPGRRLHLPGRGTTFIREVTGPAGAPVLLLVHGWMASGGLNWFTAFDTLGARFRVVAPDLRGHGRGIRSPRRFRLADCADDLAATLEELGVDRAIVVGYSMGGPVSQLLWRRHPQLVGGLVQCATLDHFIDSTRDRVVFTSAMSAAAGTSALAGVALRLATSDGRRLPQPAVYRRARTIQRWAAGEMRRHDWTKVFEAGRALGNYDARGWFAGIDVPTAFVVTTKDRALPAPAQLAMAARLADPLVFTIDGGHTVCASMRFAPTLLKACVAVAERWRPSPRPTAGEPARR